MSVYGGKVIAENEDEAKEIGTDYYAKHGIYGLTTVIDGKVSIGDISTAEFYKEKYEEFKSQGGSVDKLENMAMDITKYLPFNDKWFEGKLKQR